MTANTPADGQEAHKLAQGKKEGIVQRLSRLDRENTRLSTEVKVAKRERDDTFTQFDQVLRTLGLEPGSTYEQRRIIYEQAAAAAQGYVQKAATADNPEEVNDLKRRIAEAEAELTAKADEATRLRSEVRNYETQIADLRDEVGIAQANYAREERRAKRYEAENKQLVSEVGDANSRASAAEVESRAARSELEQIRARYSTSDDELQRLRDEVARLQTLANENLSKACPTDSLRIIELEEANRELTRERDRYRLKVEIYKPYYDALNEIDETEINDSQNPKGDHS